MKKPLDIIILGAGSRGSLFGDYFAENPDKGKIVGVAEPRKFWREKLAAKHNVPVGNVFESWDEAAARSKFADAVIITTQDKMHTEPAVAFADMGYHIMLEKPMATTEEDCQKIVKSMIKNNVIFSVCHCLRYTPSTQKVKQIIDSGKIGEVVNIQRLEPVGYWHQAHSFVRGEWSSSKKSSPMLLAKSCHDIDWIAYIMGKDCMAVSSFGSLAHFKKENKPEGAADRCINCQIESECSYSAKRLYMNKLNAKDYTWPLDVVTSDFTEEGLNKSLQNGPYGRCIYECDNDVVDNQVVNMLFESGKTASLTMTAFCDHQGRKTNIFGTKGHLFVSENKIKHFNFLNNKTETINTDENNHSILGGHGGGDYALANAFVEAVKTNDQSKILSGPLETLHTHRIVFRAEQARNTGTVVKVKEQDFESRLKIKNIPSLRKKVSKSNKRAEAV